LAWLDLDDAQAHVVDRVPGAYLTFVGDDTLYRAGFQAQSIAKYDVSGTPTEVARGKVHWPLGLAANRHVLWVTNHRRSLLLRLDTDSLKTTRKLQIGEADGEGVVGASDLVWVGDRLWMLAIGVPTVYELDGRSGGRLREVTLGTEDAGGLTPTTAGLWTWVGDRYGDARGSQSLDLIDPGEGRVTARVHLRDPSTMEEDQRAMVGGPVELDGEIWVPFDRYLVHLDAANGWAPDRVLGLPDGTEVINSVVAGNYWWYYSPLPTPHVARVPLSDLAPLE
jgi:hypothetical protein